MNSVDCCLSHRQERGPGNDSCALRAQQLLDTQCSDSIFDNLDVVITADPEVASGEFRRLLSSTPFQSLSGEVSSVIALGPAIWGI